MADVELGAELVELRGQVDSLLMNAYMQGVRRGLDMAMPGVLELRRAITDEGPAPRAHWQIMTRHRREWPVLWKAIDKLTGRRP